MTAPASDRHLGAATTAWAPHRHLHVVESDLRHPADTTRRSTS